MFKWRLGFSPGCSPLQKETWWWALEWTDNKFQTCVNSRLEATITNHLIVGPALTGVLKPAQTLLF